MTWVVEEVGLSNRQVWAAVLDEISRRHLVPGFTRLSWLEPAVLVGRDGDTLLLGVSTEAAVGQVERLLPEVRKGLAAVLGHDPAMRVVRQDEVARKELAS